MYTRSEFCCLYNPKSKMCENTNNILPGVAIRLYTQDMKWIIREVEVSRTSCSIVAIRLAAYHRALNHLYKIQYLFLCWLAGVSGWWWLFHLNKHVILQRTRNCCQPTFPYLPQEFKEREDATLGDTSRGALMPSSRPSRRSSGSETGQLTIS